MITRSKSKQAPHTPVIPSSSSHSSNNTMSTTVSHKVTNIAPSVIKFAGRKKGELTCDLEGFLTQLDAYLASKPQLDSIDRLNEAKQFLEPDASKGDISLFIRTNKYSQLQTYSEFKAYLRKAYANVGESDPVNSLGIIMNKYRTEAGTLKDLSPSIYDWINEWVERVKLSTPEDDFVDSTTWVQKNDSGDYFMQLKDVATMLRLALMLGTCNPLVVRQIEREWDPYDDLTEVLEETRKAQIAIPETELKQSLNTVHSSNSPSKVYKPNTPSGQSTSHSPIAHHSSAQTGQHSHRSYPQKAAAPSTDVQQVQCYICNRSGHMAQHCRYRHKYCRYHRRLGHHTRDCRTRQAYDRSNSQHRNVPQQRHQSPSPGNRNQHQNRQYQGNSQRNKSPSTQTLNTLGPFKDFRLAPATYLPT